MSLSFQERFKNRSNFVGKQGGINIDGTTAISKPLDSQVFNSQQYYQFKVGVLTETDLNPQVTNQFEGKNQLSPRPSRIAEPFARKQAHSANPYRTVQDSTRTELKTSQGVKAIEEYKPYTLKDYQNIKADKYYELGGLGPSNLGTED